MSLAVPRTPTVRTNLAGWGRHPAAVGETLRPERLEAALGAVTSPQWPTLVARGLGRSYGDACFDPEGCTLLTERLDRMLSFDEETGWLRAEAGVTFQEILEVFLPRGWFLPVTPGTKHVCLGGAVACDVHGKNHHRDGSLARHLGSLRMALASGEVVECSRQESPDLFGATVGGVGLTGLLLEAEMRLVPVETAWIRGRTLPARDLDSLMGLLEENDSRHRYSVAWLDCLASGASLGRGIVMLGDHAEREDLPSGHRTRPLAGGGRSLVTIPLDAPPGMLNSLTIRAFNEMYFAMMKRRPEESLVPLHGFFYPLDAVGGWNRLYGPRGFVQYQFVVPPATARAAVRDVLERCASRRRGSFLTVLKRFGPGEGGLSFPFEGYTLTLDLPVSRGLMEFLDGLDRLVLEAGGRVYLAKDSRLAPGTFRAMYPEYPRWLEVKRRYDPGNRFQSALSRRLGLGLDREAAP